MRFLHNIGQGIIRIVSRFDIFNLGNSVALVYFGTFLLAPILVYLGIHFRFEWLGYHISNKIFFLIFGGLVAFIIGYANPFTRKLVMRIRNPLRGVWDNVRAKRMFVLIFILGIGVKLVRIFFGGYGHLTISDAFAKSPFYSLFGILDWLGYFAIGIAFLMYFRLLKEHDPAARVWRWIAWGALSLELVYAIPSCSRLAVVAPLLFYIIPRWYVWKKNYLGLFLAFLFVAVIVFPLGNVCRNKSLIGFYTVSQYNENSLAVSKSFLENFLYRLDQATYFSRVTERIEPSYRLNVLKDFLVSAGPPRFLWKQKPAIYGDGNKLGHELGVLYPDDTVTSIGRTILGDWYLNFGTWGVIFGMLFMGILWRAIYEFLIIGSGVSASGILFYIPVWIYVLQGLQDRVGSIYGGLFKILVMFSILQFFLKTMSNHSKNYS